MLVDKKKGSWREIEIFAEREGGRDFFIPTALEILKFSRFYVKEVIMWKKLSINTRKKI